MNALCTIDAEKLFVTVWKKRQQTTNVIMLYIPVSYFKPQSAYLFEN